MTTRASAAEAAGPREPDDAHETVAGVGRGLHHRTATDRPTGKSGGGERGGEGGARGEGEGERGEEEDRGRGEEDGERGEEEGRERREKDRGRGEEDEGRGRKSSGAVRHFTVRHDGVTIPVSRGGRGRPLVLCPGLLVTQADLHELTGLLRRDHDVVTFDLRGHGPASAADRYSFDAFLGDLGAVLARLDLPSAPLLVGYSLGADLVVRHASAHPDTVAGLVLVDGANPLPEPFITDADEAAFRALAQDLASRHGAEPSLGSARRAVLTAQDIHDLNVEIDGVRSGLLDHYRRIDRPITMIMSASIAGDSTEGRAPRHNRLWRAGVERLVRARPHVSASWLDADHRLVLTHAADVARLIRDAHRPWRRSGFLSGREEIGAGPGRERDGSGTRPWRQGGGWSDADDR